MLNSWITVLKNFFIVFFLHQAATVTLTFPAKELMQPANTFELVFHGNLFTWVPLF